jgi:hypothetical protein
MRTVASGVKRLGREAVHSPLSSKKVKFFLRLTNSALRHEGVWGSGYIDPYFLALGITWR